MQQTIYAVSQVNEYIKSMLDCDELLSEIFIRGELSNYKVYPSGRRERRASLSGPNLKLGMSTPDAVNWSISPSCSNRL